MPFARIITHSVTDAGPLAEQLRARGFDVQMVCGEEMPFDPADLEINLKECTAEEALRRAAGLVSARRARHVARSAAIPRPAPPATEPPNAFPSSPVTSGQLAIALPATATAPQPTLTLVESHSFGSAQPAPEPVSAWLRLSWKTALQMFFHDDLFWKMAALTGSAAVVLLAAVALFHRFSPLPAALLEGSGRTLQLSPFQKASQGRPSTKPVVAAQPPAPASPPVAVVPSQTVIPDEPASTFSNSVRPSDSTPMPTRRRVSSHTDADLVAKDTVVHYGAAKALARADRKLPGVKYYSDLK